MRSTRRVAIAARSRWWRRARPRRGARSIRAYGIYYDRREPSFYTGFAPRTLDPARLHLHVGRGNQLRVTVVLADDVARATTRATSGSAGARTARSIDGGRLVLTQNRAFDDVRGASCARSSSSGSSPRRRRSRPDALRERNLALLERLNPGRVFRIRMPVDDVVRRWAAEVRPEDRRARRRARGGSSS